MISIKKKQVLNKKTITMKTIKTLFAILFLSTFFIACEADTVNEEVGIEEFKMLAEDGDEEVVPTNN